MTPACWNAIDRAREAVDVGLAPSRVGGDAQRVETTLAEVSSFVLGTLDHANATFRAAQIQRIEPLLVLLACFIDERAVGMIPAQYRGAWPWLQVRWLGGLTGGRTFYETVSTALTDPASHVQILDLAGYCLANGYKGKLAGDDAARQQVRARIEQALDTIGRPAHTLDTTTSHVLGSGVPWLTPRFVYAACTATWITLIVAFVTWK